MIHANPGPASYPPAVLEYAARCNDPRVVATLHRAVHSAAVEFGRSYTDNIAVARLSVPRDHVRAARYSLVGVGAWPSLRGNSRKPLPDCPSPGPAPAVAPGCPMLHPSRSGYREAAYRKAVAHRAAVLLAERFEGQIHPMNNDEANAYAYRRRRPMARHEPGELERLVIKQACDRYRDEWRKMRRKRSDRKPERRLAC